MMRQLPPLNHLKAFESAGRLGSFANAASELGVSDSAISQHVRSLEDFLGAPLFLRSYSGVTLTEAGNDYLPHLTSALDLIETASTEFRKTHLTGALRVSVVPSLGSRWLLPRLEQFSRAYPHISVEPLITPQIVRLGEGEADIAIRHGNGNWIDADVSFLRDEKLVPVAAPDYIRRKKVNSVRELLECPLLSASARRLEWPHWFVSQGVSLPASQRFITYDTIALAIDAAIAGIGVSLVDRSLVSEDIRLRRLKIVFDFPVSGLGAYFVAMPKMKTTSPKAIAFRNWLIAESASDSV